MGGRWLRCRSPPADATVLERHGAPAVGAGWGSSLGGGVAGPTICWVRRGGYREGLVRLRLDRLRFREGGIYASVEANGVWPPRGECVRGECDGAVQWDLREWRAVGLRWTP